MSVALTVSAVAVEGGFARWTEQGHFYVISSAMMADVGQIPKLEYAAVVILSAVKDEEGTTQFLAPYGKVARCEAHFTVAGHGVASDGSPLGFERVLLSHDRYMDVQVGRQVRN